MTEHTYLKGDSYLELVKLDQDYVHGTVTSPPYYGKLDYGHPGQIGHETFENYLNRLACVFTEVYRVTKPGGALLLNINDTWNNVSPVRSRLAETKESTYTGQKRRPLVPGYREKEKLPVTSLMAARLRLSGWLHRDTWVWSKGRGRPTGSDRPGQSHEYVLYCRKPDKPGRYRELYWSGDHLNGSVHHYEPVSHPEHPCPFPLEMALDYVMAIVPKGGTVLDPFAGVCTVAKAARQLGVNSVSIDIKEW